MGALCGKEEEKYKQQQNFQEFLENLNHNTQNKLQKIEYDHKYQDH